MPPQKSRKVIQWSDDEVGVLLMLLKSTVIQLTWTQSSVTISMRTAVAFTKFNY